MYRYFCVRFLTQSGAVDEHQIDVVAKQTHQTNGKHDGNEEQEEYVKATHAAAVKLSLFQVMVFVLYIIHISQYIYV